MASTVWRGHLAFGLISIPVRLFRAARAERTPLRRVARSSSSGSAPSTAPAGKVDLLNRQSILSKGRNAAEENEFFAAAGGESKPQHNVDLLIPLRQTSLRNDTHAPVPESAVTRAVEVDKNRFVEIPADELQKLKAPTSPDLAIQEFVALSEIDPLYFETSYYVVPEEVGEKAYALLYQALVQTNVVALAELSMHGRDHVVVIRPGQTGLVAHTMFYVSEVHLEEQFQADTSAVSAKELELAKTLVSTLTSAFAPEKYKNGYHQAVQQLIADRVSESAQVRTAPARLPAGREVVDIADALRKSLTQLKKPVQPAAAVNPPSRAAGRGKRATSSGA